MYRSEEVLRFENVWYSNEASKDHIDNVSFTLKRGEGLLISGPEGSGKSQLMALIIAKNIPKSGQVFHDGVNLNLQSEDEMEKLRFSIGYVTKTSGLINNLSVMENIILPLRYHTALKDDELFAAADLWLERYELKHKEKARPVALSDSEAIRTALIRALIVDPRIILLDGIIDGVCPLASRRMLELMFQDIQMRGISYVISTYHPAIFEGRDMQFILLYRGEVVFQGSLADIKMADNVFLDQYRALKTEGPMRCFNDTL
jgi:ABC-type transporter Mla maintaining outer membrane lipid asymmetry ATPase subunit MlaF